MIYIIYLPQEDFHFFTTVIVFVQMRYVA